jgi:hypothetical protein
MLHSYRCVFALFVLISLGLKLLAFERRPTNVEERVNEAVVAYLESAGYDIAYDHEADPVYFAVHRKGCEMRIYLASPEGWHRDIIRRLGEAQLSSFFVYDGEIFDEQPVWTTWLEFQMQRIKSTLGLQNATKPVLGISSSAGCRRNEIIWSKLARVVL